MTDTGRKTTHFDVLIIGAGAAGMMCAMTAGQRGRSVMLLDHSAKLAEKIRISGGGRCNFTNLQVKPEHYVSQNPDFCRSALAQFPPHKIIALLEKHGVAFHEKTQGQLFCDEGSEAIIDLLLKECEIAGVHWCRPCKVESVSHQGQFKVETSRGRFTCDSLVVATGGLSIPKIGATPLGYQLANQFNIPVTKLKPGLVPLSFHPDSWSDYAALSGVSLAARICFGRQCFLDNLLFTHRGLSGPAILQISSYWVPGQPLLIDLLPDHDIESLMQGRSSKMLLSNFLGQYLPHRLADLIAVQWASDKPVNQLSEKIFRQLLGKLKRWELTPTGTLGYGKAEVTCGGIDTHALSSKNMECRQQPGLYFIGEVVDVTGQLGGYNFQWAWASGYAAGQTC